MAKEQKGVEQLIIVNDSPSEVHMPLMEQASSNQCDATQIFFSNVYWQKHNIETTMKS